MLRAMLLPMLRAPLFRCCRRYATLIFSCRHAAVTLPLLRHFLLLAVYFRQRYAMFILFLRCYLLSALSLRAPLMLIDVDGADGAIRHADARYAILMLISYDYATIFTVASYDAMRHYSR